MTRDHKGFVLAFLLLPLARRSMKKGLEEKAEPFLLRRVRIYSVGSFERLGPHVHHL